MRLSFEELGVGKSIAGVCKGLDITEPSDIQQSCIPEILAGRNVLGVATTGSGKTLAFTLPMLRKLQENPFGVFGLVLTPTRELAIQIQEQILAFGSTLGVTCETVLGRMDSCTQQLAIRTRPNFIVATPGRLAQLLESDDLRECFQHLAYLVLDEADRLLCDGFSESLASILSSIPPATARGTLLFTATVTPLLSKVAMKYGLKTIDATTEDQAHQLPTRLEQHVIYHSRLLRYQILFWQLGGYITADKEHRGRQAIVFVGGCLECEETSWLLSELGVAAVALHGQLSQAMRTRHLQQFRLGAAAKGRGKTVLVATDVAARGLDIPKVGLVVNLGLPREPVDYVHRVGRTARAGLSGRALTIIDDTAQPKVDEIVELTGQEWETVEVTAAEEDRLTGPIAHTVNQALVKVKRRISDGGLADKIRDGARRRTETRRAGNKRRAKAAEDN